jgi:hypothetical protein
MERASDDAREPSAARAAPSHLARCSSGSRAPCAGNAIGCQALSVCMPMRFTCASSDSSKVCNLASTTVHRENLVGEHISLARRVATVAHTQLISTRTVVTHVPVGGRRDVIGCTTDDLAIGSKYERFTPRAAIELPLPASDKHRRVILSTGVRGVTCN